MRVLNLKNDFGIDRSDETKAKDIAPDQQITRNVISFVFHTFYDKGVKSDTRRLIAKILKSADDAIRNKKDTFDVSEVEFGLLKQVFADVTIPAESVGNVDIVEGMILGAKAAADTKAA